MVLVKILENVCKIQFFKLFSKICYVKIIKYPRCDRGWKGDNCDECITLPDCENGKCRNNQPYTCECDEGWLGPFCDCPKCRSGRFFSLKLQYII